MRAYTEFRAAGDEALLDAADVESLATAAYMLGRDREYRDLLARAHRLHIEDGNPRLAARCAFWVGLSLLLRGKQAPADGWFARADRLLEPDGVECVKRGYLLVPSVLGYVAEGQDDSAYTAAATAVEIGIRFRDPDLIAIARHEQGQALVRQGRTDDGLRLVDEAMVAVTAGELSPIVTGLIYCNTNREHRLSGRETQVLRYLAAGFSNKDIAAELVLSKRPSIAT